MENAYLTAGDLALYEQHRGWNPYANGFYPTYPYGCDHRKSDGCKGAAITGVVLGGVGFATAIAVGWGLNQASKARSRASEKTMEMIAATLNREAVRNDGINLDVTQTLRSLTGATAQGGSAGSFAGASALAQAEANLLSGAITGQYARCPQEVTLVSKRNCPCPGDCN